MSQQSLNVAQVVLIVRRHRIFIGAVALLGLLAGAAFSVLNPPLVTSYALVVLPQDVPGISTQAVIASSVPVLSAALPAIAPPMSLQTLEKQVSTQSPTSSIVSISARGKSAAQAESAANAVARSYIAYVTNPASPVGHVVAQMLEPASATTTSGMAAPAQDALDAGLGVLAGFLAGVLLAIVIARRTRKLVQLDDIARSIGLPVLAAVPVGHPSDASGWTRLLDGYEPGSVEAWRLRQALQEIMSAAASVSSQGAALVTALSMSADTAALALGPQLAAYAASLGIPTVLVTGPQPDTMAAAALYTACGAPQGPQGSSKRSRFLRTLAADSARVAIPSAARLVVVVAVVEDKTLQLPETMPTAVTVLSVAAGAASEEQLARLAVAASSDSREVIGLLVADPDQSDRTTGRFLRPAKGGRHAYGAPAPAPRVSVPVPVPATETRRMPEPRPMPEPRRMPEPASVVESWTAVKAEPKPESDRKLAPERVLETEPELAHEPGREPRSASEPPSFLPRPTWTPRPAFEPRPESGSDVKPETEPEFGTEPETEAETEAETGTEAGTGHAFDRGPVFDAGYVLDRGSIFESGSETETEGEPEPEFEPVEQANRNNGGR